MRYNAALCPSQKLRVIGQQGRGGNPFRLAPLGRRARANRKRGKEAMSSNTNWRGNLHLRAAAGFTQVALLVVVVVMTLLAAVLLASDKTGRRDASAARATRVAQDAVAVVATGACCRLPECAIGGACASGFPHCHSIPSCLCFQTAEGGTACTIIQYCKGLQACPGGTSTCPQGEVCLVNTCCPGPPVCAPAECPTGASATELSDFDPENGPTTAGDQGNVSGETTGECVVMDRFTCESEGGVYKGDGVPCTAATCTEPTEACCLPSGECHDAVPASCVQLGGVPQGTNSECGSASGCCFGNGDCDDLAPVCCADRGGTPMGDSTSCAANCCTTSDCPADSKCVDRFCNLADHTCKAQNINGCCRTDADCPVDTCCVDSYCDQGSPANLFDNFCAVRPVAGCCVSDAACPLDTECVDSFCALVGPPPLCSVCDTEPVPGCCRTDADCPADTTCVDRYCNFENPADPLDNSCDFTVVAGCCITDADCPADTPCRDNFCNAGGPGLFDSFCDTTVIAGCCINNSECPEGSICIEHECRVTDPGDCNQDGHVDLIDVAFFQNCFTGPGGPNRCACTDLDADDDTDLDDAKIFIEAITGP